MGLFGDLIKTGFDIVTLPVAVVADVASLGQGRSATKTVLENLHEDAQDMADDLDNLDLL